MVSVLRSPLVAYSRRRLNANNNKFNANENERRPCGDLANCLRGFTREIIAQPKQWADFALQRTGGLKWDKFERNETVPTGTGFSPAGGGGPRGRV